MPATSGERNPVAPGRVPDRTMDAVVDRHGARRRVHHPGSGRIRAARGAPAPFDDLIAGWHEARATFAAAGR